MPQLVATIVTADEEFRRQVSRLLRAGGVPLGIVEEARSGGQALPPDLAVIDARRDCASALATIERLRAEMPALAIFTVAEAVNPDLILQAMRAGANEFFAWNGEIGPPTPGSTEEAFLGAVRRTAARRESANGHTRQPSLTLVFFGAKGGAGTTTVAVNCGVELARLTRRSAIMVDLKPSLGEVALFLGVRPRFTVVDAIENLHRLDRDFLRELVAKHKSGLDILAATEQLDRSAAHDPGVIEELLRILARAYDFVIVDAGNLVNSGAAASLYVADTIFLVANPDVPSVRNAQRLVDRVRQLGAGGERVRIILNRTSERHLITPKQIETALGIPVYHTFPSDYWTVSTALNSGVPLALTERSEIAEQFDRFTRRIVEPNGAEPRPVEKRRSFFGLL